MYTIKTDPETMENKIIDTLSLPQDTVCKFMRTIGEAREELYYRELLKNMQMLSYYISSKQYDF